jgi:hypothetical protein
VEGIGNGGPSRVTLAGRAPSLVFSCLLLGACKSRPAERADYRVVRSAAPAESLLAADEGAWSTSKRIEWGPDAYATVFRGAWTSAGFFVRFDATDPDIWHTLTHHDDKLWDEEVVEIFLQPAGSQGDYGEVEISPANVTCDVWVSPAVDFPGSKSSPRQFDVAWNLEGLESRVTLHDGKAGRAIGWTAVAFLPWHGFASAAKGARLPPGPRDCWRFNVFRIERPGGKDRPEEGALYLAWAPTGKKSFHVPEAFRDLTFVSDD